MTVRVVPKGLLIALLAACVACSGGGLNPATGKVTVKGEAAKGAVVIFHPKDAKIDSQRPSGVANDNGEFTLTTGTKPGAPAGDYVVTITWPGAVDAKAKAGKVMGTDMEAPEAPDRLGRRYADPAQSKLTAVIKSGSNTIPTFDLQ